MTQLRKSAVSLRIWGDDLIPENITNMLGVSSTRAQLKGEKIVGRKTGQTWIAQTGAWHFSVPKREPEDMDGQIQEVFSQMTSDLSVWHDIAKRYQIDLFCGLFMGVSNEGLSLSP